MPFVVDVEEGVGERTGPRDGEVFVGSVEGRRPDTVPAGGFFVAVDIAKKKKRLVVGVVCWVIKMFVDGRQNPKLGAIRSALSYK